MIYSLYGYNLNGHIEFRSMTGVLVNINNGKSSKLNDTSKLLLNYLLSKGSHSFISDNDIAIHVFNANDRRYSSSALWRAIKRLEESFLHVGSVPKFIKRYQRCGYYIDLHFKEILIAKDI
jgi:DNA-binding winged helix-turn-helix (wHTH) protein